MALTDTKHINYKIAGVHLLLWGLYLLSEFLANLYHYPEDAHGQLLRDTLLSLPILMGATYFIAYSLVPRYLRRRKLWLFTGFTLLVAVAVFWSRVYWLAGINYLESGEFQTFPPSKILKNVIRDYSIIALGVCLKIIDDWYRKDRLARELQRARMEAELQLLRGQLHPHFLFNTLNNLYGLALRRSDQTAHGIHRLSQMLDYLLYSSKQESVSLRREIEFLNDYLELERLRYGERLHIQLHLPEQIPDLSIAPLLFLPFVENAFKHGGKNREGQFQIEVSLDIRKDRQLLFTLKNTVNPGSASAKKQGGIGLKNIRQRLDHLYPDRHALYIEENPECFRVEMGLDAGG